MSDLGQNVSSRSLIYRGDGWYTATLNPTVKLELSYEGASDYAVGDWVLAEIVIDGETIRVNDFLRNEDSPLVRWLEDEARKGGHLPDEPVRALTDAEYDRSDGHA